MSSYISSILSYNIALLLTSDIDLTNYSTYIYFTYIYFDLIIGSIDFWYMTNNINI